DEDGRAPGERRLLHERLDRAALVRDARLDLEYLVAEKDLDVARQRPLQLRDEAMHVRLELRPVAVVHRARELLVLDPQPFVRRDERREAAPGLRDAGGGREGRDGRACAALEAVQAGREGRVRGK